MAATLAEAIGMLKTESSKRQTDQQLRNQLPRCLHEIKAALHNPGNRDRDGWLTARASVINQNRAILLGKLRSFEPQVLSSDSSSLRKAAARLLHDLEHHQQRLSNLIYDSVELELGGSE